MYTSGAGICATRKIRTAVFEEEALSISRIIAQLPSEIIWATRATDSTASVFVLRVARGTRFYWVAMTAEWRKGPHLQTELCLGQTGFFYLPCRSPAA